jgi:hypothetical protein
MTLLALDAGHLGRQLIIQESPVLLVSGYMTLHTSRQAFLL